MCTGVGVNPKPDTQTVFEKRRAAVGHRLDFQPYRGSRVLYPGPNGSLATPSILNPQTLEALNHRYC